MVKFNSKQTEAITKIDKFIESDDKIFYLLGCAGSGKTFLTSSKIINLLSTNKIDTVFVCAPTHQALNVIESYIKSNIYADAQPDYLSKINFMTIHKLLEFRPIIMADTGSKIFKSRCESKYIKKIERKLILLDECSMVSNDMYAEIVKYLDLYPIKIIFMGDSAQLPPVGEVESPVFNIPKKYEHYILLDQVMRTKSTDIKTVCSIIRNWDTSSSLCKELVPIFQECRDKSFRMYHKKSDHTQATWFINFVKKLKSGEFPIILTWQNSTANYYNGIIRKHIHTKSDLKDYEVGDHAIFNNYYMSAEGESFYTCDKIRILEIFRDDKELYQWSELLINTPKTLVEREFNALIKKLSKQDCVYQIDKFRAEKIYSDTVHITNNQVHTVQTINRADLQNYLSSMENIREHIKFFHRKFKSEILTNKLWSIFHKYFVEPYATINFGYSITTHKAQGSTFGMVLIDYSDLCENKNVVEFKKALYTASGRASTELGFIL